MVTTIGPRTADFPSKSEKKAFNPDLVSLRLGYCDGNSNKRESAQRPKCLGEGGELPGSHTQTKDKKLQQTKTQNKQTKIQKKGNFPIRKLLTK